MAHNIRVASAEQFLSTLPTNSVDLLFTSPPYEDARTYGMPAMPKGEAWVSWMLNIVRLAAPKVRGLIVIVCEGKTRGYRYSSVPMLLGADLHRAGYNLRKPGAYIRNGISGSGGPDWLRNDWEYILCISRPGKLAFADATARSTPPKYRNGGVATSRAKDGTRARAKQYAKPVLVNPGNAVRYTGDIWYDLMELFIEVIAYAYATEISPAEILRSVQQAVSSGSIYEWGAGVSARLHASSILRPDVYGACRKNAIATAMPILQSRVPSAYLGNHLLLREVLHEQQEESGASGSSGQQFSEGSPTHHDTVKMREVRDKEAASGSSQRRKPSQQRKGKPRSSLRDVPRDTPQPIASIPSSVRGVWQGRIEELQGIWDIVRQALPTLQEAWLSTYSQGETRFGVGAGDSSNAARYSVGGGHMGHALAHDNEAPFPLELALDWIARFCPVGGVVCDPFIGSGTTLHAAELLGRNCWGCDVRQSQVDLSMKRLENVRATA